MNVTALITGLIKTAIVLLITGYLGKATYHYALKIAHEEQFGLINLVKFSRSLESGR
jgi:hypothetical protein